MASIRDYAVTIYTTATASMVCEMPAHETGDLLVAFVNKDTASNFTTPAGWTARQTQTSAGAAGGIYTKRAASSSETVTFTLTSETCCAVIIAVKDCNGTTEADAVSGSAKSGADDSTLPLTGVGITPSHNNCLILHGLSTDSGIAPAAYAPWVNLFAGDATANSLCVSYTQQKTAAAITAPAHWTGAAADDSRGFIIAIRDKGSAPTSFDAYIPLSNVSSSRLLTMSNVASVDETAGWRSAAGIVITSVAGKTVSGVLPQTTADSGINPFRPSVTTGGVSSTTNLGHSECPFSASKDFTAKQGLVFGTFMNTTPRDYVDTGKATQGGKYILFGSATPASNHRAWVVGGQFTQTEHPANRNPFLIEVGNTDTVYANAGTANMAAVTDVAIGSSGYYGAASVRWCELHLLDVTKIAGGSADNPIDFDDLVFVVNNGNSILPLIEQAGASGTLWLPLQFGGVDALFCNFNLNTFQYPRRADEVDYVNFHVSNNKVGIEIYGLSGDVINFTNCVFTSPSPYYWRVNASASASATYDFSGTTIVGATVTLKDVTTWTGMAFIGCPTLDFTACDLSGCEISSVPTTDGTLTISTGTSFTGCTFDVSDVAVGGYWGSLNGAWTFGTDCEFIGGGGHLFRSNDSTNRIWTSAGNTFTGFGPAVRDFHTNSDVDAGTDVVTTDAAHGYANGDPVYYQKHGGSAAVGLTNSTLYYVRAVSSTTLAFYTSAANAIADTSRIALTAAAPETHYIYSAKAAILNNGTGTLTISVTDGGDSPSYRRTESAGAVTVTNNVSVVVNGLVAGSRVYIRNTTDGVDLFNQTEGDSTFSELYNYTGDKAILVRVRKSTSGTKYKTWETTGTITSTGFTVTANQIVDE